MLSTVKHNTPVLLFRLLPIASPFLTSLAHLPCRLHRLSTIPLRSTTRSHLSTSLALRCTTDNSVLCTSCYLLQHAFLLPSARVTGRYRTRTEKTRYQMFVMAEVNDLMSRLRL